MNSLTHTHTIIANAVDIKGVTRHIALLYRQQDGWFNNNGQSNHDAVFAALTRLIREDNNIIGYQGDRYRLENGLYIKTSEGYPVMAK